nr:MAG TPA: hypothetical protein [Caudoviricetes sp.]
MTVLRFVKHPIILELEKESFHFNQPIKHVSYKFLYSCRIYSYVE